MRNSPLMPDVAMQTSPQTVALRLTDPGTVLIVDDLLANLRLLESILKYEGFHVVTATSGAEALDVVGQCNPDVVLLDVMMPLMDGFEVCSRLRAEAATAHLPVVMVTALQNTEDRVRALEAGADDFLSKPVEAVEVLARVRSLVRAKRDRDALENAYADLKRSEEQRDNLNAMLVHDLRTPLTTMLAAMDLMKSGQAGELNELQQQVTDMSMRGGQHLLTLVNELLDISKLESGEMKLQYSQFHLPAMVSEAIWHVEAQAKFHTTAIEVEAAPDLPPLDADPDLVRRVLINLLGNAVKFTSRGSTIKVRIERSTDPRGLVTSIRDFGEGIRPEDQARIFERFGQAQVRREGRLASSGLGLTFCKLALEAHGGRIWVESAREQGSTFYALLPVETSG